MLYTRYVGWLVCESGSEIENENEKKNCIGKIRTYVLHKIKREIKKS